MLNVYGGTVISDSSQHRRWGSPRSKANKAKQLSQATNDQPCHKTSTALFLWWLYLSLLAILVIVVASNIKLVSATPNPSFSDILRPSPNVTGGPAGEIQCYALPYGAIGIISHLLTYWTMAWMAVGRLPLWPWHSLAKYRF